MISNSMHGILLVNKFRPQGWICEYTSPLASVAIPAVISRCVSHLRRYSWGLLFSNVFYSRIVSLTFHVDNIGYVSFLGSFQRHLDNFSRWEWFYFGAIMRVLLHMKEIIPCIMLRGIEFMFDPHQATVCVWKHHEVAQRNPLEKRSGNRISDTYFQGFL